MGMCLTEDGFITEVLPESQDPWVVSDGSEHESNSAWNLIKRHRLGQQPFEVTVIQRPRISPEEMGLGRPDRMHLPPDWVEVVPPGWGTQGKSYYRNSWTGQCCEFQPLPHPAYPLYPNQQDRLIRDQRLRALRTIARAALATQGKQACCAHSFGCDKQVLFRLLKDFVHDLHEPLRQRAIECLGELSVTQGFLDNRDILNSLQSRAKDDSPVVLTALIDALVPWKDENRHVELRRIAAKLIRTHSMGVEAYRLKFPDGFGFRMDVDDFLGLQENASSDEESNKSNY
ncbi:unnamed protein product [Durusdinium trenchii]|uniref:WW domain-containing protein n=1 Tax=Durusdinium trenchii TaxID=1381693 RepID=A0ABP0NKQ0_9DINO